MSCSSAVTDEGIKNLLFQNGECNENVIFNPCCQTLKHVKLRGTRVRKDGLLLLLKYSLALEGVRCNIMDVLSALSTFLKDEKSRNDGSPLTLKYFDFSSCYTIFASKLQFLQNLNDVRIGADVPPECRKTSRKHRSDVRPPSDQMCRDLECLQMLPFLTTLVLKDIRNQELDLVLSKCGKRLKKLDLHFMHSGVDLLVISSHAKYLTNLSISDSKILPFDGKFNKDTFLPLLNNCKLMRVTYDSGSETVLISNCKNLKILHQEGGSEFSDAFIGSLVEDNELKFLEEIVIVGNCDLGLSSLLFLTSLPSLVRIGDVMDWKLDNDTRCRLNQIHGGWDVTNGHLKREY